MNICGDARGALAWVRISQRSTTAEPALASVRYSLQACALLPVWTDVCAVIVIVSYNSMDAVISAVLRNHTTRPVLRSLCSAGCTAASCLTALNTDLSFGCAGTSCATSMASTSWTRPTTRRTASTRGLKHNLLVPANNAGVAGLHRGPRRAHAGARQEPPQRHHLVRGQRVRLRARCASATVYFLLFFKYRQL